MDVEDTTLYLTNATDNSFMPRSYIDKNIMNNGITTNRPSTPDDFEQYFDTTLGQPIVFNGSIWVDYLGDNV